MDYYILLVWPNELVDEEEAKELERKYVNQVYENIADHFSDTRYKPWPKVSSFLSTVPPGSLILDIGCGNGKNMGLSHQCFEIGCDASTKLSEVCSNRNIQVLTADCLKLPFRNDCADVVICIAVIHHLSTKARRAKAINEILRVLRHGGKALVYVWAFEQDGPEGPSNYLKLSKQAIKINNKNENTTEIQLNECTDSPKTIKMPVHKNRTNFVEQDMLVPWKEKKSCQSAVEDSEITIHHRYYHVFYEGELENLVTENEGCILSSYYDKGNWCVLFQKQSLL